IVLPPTISWARWRRASSEAAGTSSAYGAPPSRVQLNRRHFVRVHRVGATYNPATPNLVALGPGTRLGAYDILSLLGRGGMGEVGRAKDTKLGREVALKILPATFTNDPERLARFRREAQVLASLNH